jgi:hypothetical protein
MATVFLSWSGSESKHHARAWRTWINDVFKGARVFMSDSDIKAGDDWREKLSSEVRRAKVGIVFLTTKNKNAPWILFEAGALAIAKRRRLIVCIVSGSSRTVPDPLKSRNAVSGNKSGAKKIFRVLEAEIGKPKAKFSVVWPRLENLLTGK